jgi:membrane peptidoglycan carboxypeptidase
MSKKIIKILFAASGITVAALIGAVAWFIVFSPGEKISQESIEKILAMESPVFYDDGQSRIGVFFKDAHRQYIHFNNIPRNFVNAIVAAEDNSFFTHYGVDITGILRAIQANIRAGKIVQGGSTITQQAAKNLFKRKDRSYTSKLKELLFALQLEYHYSKEKILEFYANQFYVSGNGHGLGVASRYYFDKAASELDLLECAFIAGSVKRPNYYNPFTKDSEEEILLAKERAKQRTAYVLKQMYKMGAITVEQYQAELDRDISFQKGKMKYPLNTLMDVVKEALTTPAVEESLAQHGIENVSTSGIRIFTTVNKGLQENALYVLRKELSRLDVRLLGYNRDEVQDRYADIQLTETQERESGSFVFGRITEINLSGAPSISVSIGDRQEKGRIDEAGLQSILDSYVKYLRQRWSEADSFDLPLLLEQLKIGDLVYVNIQNKNTQTGEYILELEKYPELQGAMLAMQEGAILAMVGGMENHFFNRAISAKRPMGSVMKPLVFAAALQLGWSNVDPLKNKRDVFIFQNQPYFPRPDHFSPHEHVSMSWAGVNSENVATVWLLYHLCDHLTPGQFKDLLANLGLDQRPDESYQQYSRRIRDEHGIVVDRESLYRTAFSKAVKEIEADLIFAGKLNEYDLIKTLHYGANFETYLEEVTLLEGPEYESEERQQKVIEQEMKIRTNILKNNFLNFHQLRNELKILAIDPYLYGSEELSGSLYYNQEEKIFSYATEGVTEHLWRPVSQAEFEMLTKKSLTSAEISAEGFWDAILIEGMLSPITIDLLSTYIEKEYARLSALPPYSSEVLHNIRDFRVTAGLSYLTNLGRTLGITSQLDPVLSFPLGSNVISVLETVKMYEALVTGRVTEKTTYSSGDQYTIIDHIQNSDGEIVYQTESSSQKIFTPRTSLMLDDILQNVILYGTGQYAKNNIRIESYDPEEKKQLSQLNLRIPLLGKTGTANKFTNSAFAGFIPEIASDNNGLTTDRGYALAAYVGFDDNTPMVRTSTHITGSSGALPLWTSFANHLLAEKQYGSRLDLVDIAFNAVTANGSTMIPIFNQNLGQIEVKINKDNGLPVPVAADPFLAEYAPSTATVLTFGTVNRDGEFKPSRYFSPYWQK